MIFGRKSPDPQVGQEVVTADEEHLGDVTAVQNDFLDVRGGTLDHPMTWRVPRSAVAQINGETIHLNLSRGQVLVRGWEQAAATGEGTTAPSQ
jgi:hypothetical protein